MGYPKAYQITSKRFSEYRATALAKGNKPNTINRNANRLSSVFTALIQVDEFHAEHPLKGIAKLKEQPTEMGFLSKDEIKQLLSALRHTFASHFMMNGGNILTLQKILGHGTVLQTMRYAHLSLDYLNEALTLNPLSTI